MGDADAEIQQITSSANPIVKLARQLAARRRARAREGLFLLEGVRAIESAVQHGILVQTLILDDERRGEVSPALITSMAERRARLVSVPPALISSISDTESPQPVIAVATIPAMELPGDSSCIVALDAVRDPGNLGTIVRTACAAGVDGLAFLPGCVDPFNPKTVRSAAGMVAAIPMESVRSVSEIIDRCFADASRVVVVAADSRGTRDYRDVDWKNPVVLVVGNEGHGLSAETLRDATHLVQIPIEPNVESLNVSVATGVLLFEMRRQKSGHRD